MFCDLTFYLWTKREFIMPYDVTEDENPIWTF